MKSNTDAIAISNLWGEALTAQRLHKTFSQVQALSAKIPLTLLVMSVEIFELAMSE